MSIFPFSSYSLCSASKRIDDRKPMSKGILLFTFRVSIGSQYVVQPPLSSTSYDERSYGRRKWVRFPEYTGPLGIGVHTTVLGHTSETCDPKVPGPCERSPRQPPCLGPEMRSFRGSVLLIDPPPCTSSVWTFTRRPLPLLWFDSYGP